MTRLLVFRPSTRPVSFDELSEVEIDTFCSTARVWRSRTTTCTQLPVLASVPARRIPFTPCGIVDTGTPCGGAAGWGGVGAGSAGTGRGGPRSATVSFGG